MGLLFPALYDHIRYRTMTVLSLWGKRFFHIVKNSLSELIVKGEVQHADHVAVVATAVAVSKTSFQNWCWTPVLRGVFFGRYFWKRMKSIRLLGFTLLFLILSKGYFSFRTPLFFLLFFPYLLFVFSDFSDWVWDTGCGLRKPVKLPGKNKGFDRGWNSNPN